MAAASASMRLVLAEHHALEVAVEVLQLAAVVGATRWPAECARSWRRSPRSRSCRWSSSALARGQDALRGAGLVDHVDRLVGQVAVVDVLGRQLGRGLQRRRRRT
jgi:hypothetical protein